ncbi:hypothetical protein [Pedobacter panaciterrae]
MVISLGKDLIRYIPNVSSFDICRNGKSEWIAYESKQQQETIFLNLSTDQRYTYTNVINKILGEDGQTVILKTKKKVGSQILDELIWVDLSTGKGISIWEGPKVSRFVLDSKHHQLAFVSEKGLVAYNMTTKKLDLLSHNLTTSLDSGLKIGGIKRFSDAGDGIFIELVEEGRAKANSGIVEVWSYLDPKIQPLQEKETETASYIAFLNLMDRKIIRLEREFEHLAYNMFVDGSSDTIGLITQYDRNNGDWYNRSKTSSYLISLKNGRRIPLKYSPEGLSPTGKYLVFLILSTIPM